MFSQAAGAFTEDDYDTAIELGEQSKHIALRSPAIRELLGLAYYRSEKWKEARASSPHSNDSVVQPSRILLSPTLTGP